MAQKLAKFAFRQTGPARYPDEWTNGGIWKATKGVDFKGSVQAFALALYQLAERRGKKVRLSKDEQAGVVVFQFFAPKT